MVEAAKREIEEIDGGRRRQAAGRDDVVLVDLRDPRELERDGKVPGTFHVTRGMLEFWIDPESAYFKPMFGEDKKFVFFCAGGLRSALAAKTAQDMGLKPVAHIARRLQGLEGGRRADGAGEGKKAREEVSDCHPGRRAAMSGTQEPSRNARASTRPLGPGSTLRIGRDDRRSESECRRSNRPSPPPPTSSRPTPRPCGRWWRTWPPSAPRRRRAGRRSCSERHAARGKLLPRDRVLRLIDPGSPFLELSPLAALRPVHQGHPRRRHHHRRGARLGARVRDRVQRRHHQGRHLLPDDGEEAPARPGDRAREPAAVHLSGRLRRRQPAAAHRGVPRPRALRPHLLQPGDAVLARHPADRLRDGLVHGGRRLRAGHVGRDRSSCASRAPSSSAARRW